MRVLLALLGVTLSFILLLVSASMNWRFGYTLGTAEIDRQIYGAASAAADGLKALLPFFIALRFSEKRFLAVLAGCLVWVVCTGYSMTSAIGFSALNRTQTTGVRERDVTRVADARSDLKAARAQLAALSKHRSSAVVEAALEKLWGMQFRYKGKFAALIDLTAGCTNIPGPKTRDACTQVLNLKSELATALDEDEQRRRIVTANKIIDAASGLAVSGSVDPQVAIFAKLSRMEKGTVRTALIILVAVLVETGSGLGFFLSLGLGHDRVQVRFIGINHNREELAKRFLEECTEHHGKSNVQASKLFDEYCIWIRAQTDDADEPYKPMTQTAFGRWLKMKGIEKVRINGRYHYVGLALQAPGKVRLVS